MATGFLFVAADFADARRAGGGFGSRGSRTFQAPPATKTAPNTAPIERSMTPRPQADAPSAARQPGAAAAQRPGFFGNGFAGTMMRGLLIGGLIGLLLGHGLGGLAGVLGLILQVGLAMLVATLVVRWFANRNRQPANGAAPVRREMAMAGGPAGQMSGLGSGMGSGLGRAAPMGAPPMADNGRVDQSDLDVFQQMLADVQAAYGREDFSALRERTTPEIMSYLAEELSENATAGVRNDVSDVKLLQGDVSETWHEGDEQYATVAMRYESRDVMRDRTTGDVVSGDPEEITEATELWTFVRPRDGDWKLSAIQPT
jgi:predicted lipid-binding transport protein (Tim44 family)